MLPALRKSLQNMREWVLKAPTSADAWGTLGMVFFANDYYRQSTICFAEAEKLDPTDPRWPYFQALPFAQEDKYELALPFLNRAIQRFNEQEDKTLAPRLWLSHALMSLGRNEEAETFLRQAKVLIGDDARLDFDLALLAISRQDLQGARALLLSGLDSPHVQKRARIQLAAICRHLGEVVKADEYEQQAARLPDDVEPPDPYPMESYPWGVNLKARRHYVNMLMAMGRFSEAVPFLKQTIEDFPDEEAPHRILGTILTDAGDLKGAEASFRRAIAIAPEKAQLRYELACAFYWFGEQIGKKDIKDRSNAEALFRQACQLAREAIERKPNYGEAHMRLGLSLKELGQRTDAMSELEQATRCNPESPEIQYRFGDMLAEEGRIPEASTHYERALALAPPTTPWRPRIRAQLLAWRALKPAKEPGKK